MKFNFKSQYSLNNIQYLLNKIEYSLNLSFLIPYFTNQLINYGPPEKFLLIRRNNGYHILFRLMYFVYLMLCILYILCYSMCFIYRFNVPFFLFHIVWIIFQKVHLINNGWIIFSKNHFCPLTGNLPLQLAVKGAGGSITLGRSKSSFLLFLTERSVSYQMLFTRSKNNVPSRSYRILKSWKYG